MTSEYVSHHEKMLFLHEAITEFKKLSIHEIENPTTLEVLHVIKQLKTHLEKIEMKHLIKETIREYNSEWVEKNETDLRN